MDGILKTECQRKKEEYEAKVYADYMSLVSVQENSRMEVNKLIMRKYDIYGMSTLYAIIKRVEKRMNNAKQKQNR